MTSALPPTASELSQARCIHLAYGIHRARAALESHVETFAATRGLTGTHMSILHTLGLGGEMRMKDLGARVVMGGPTLSRRAQQLEDRELIRRRRSEQSQREVLIQLTSAGESMFEASFAHLYDQHRTYFDDRFDPAEQIQLLQLFNKL
jgi:DNA-binding MarR family transcriptional regulator